MIRSLGRRRLVTGTLATAAVAAPFLQVRGAPLAFPSDPWTLGVASGAPTPDGVVLWTRLAPRPLEGGGMPGDTVEVDWQVAEDEGFARVAARGTARAAAASAHTVHVEVTGLRPARPYWYRFRAGPAVSPVGRTRTAPAPGARTDTLRLALASCQQYEHGYYAAYRDMAQREFDLVVHVGDYIYERSWGRNPVRHHGTGVPTTLDEFRTRYALYRLDPDLQAAHAAFPWLSTWDDHEVMDDYANDRSYTVRDAERFLKIRAAAYRAYWEHLPLPARARPNGPDATLYAHYRFGDAMDIVLLDDRQYRSPPACVAGGRPGSVASCDERTDERRTMLGAAQEAWFADRMRAASTRWTVVAQQTLVAELAGPAKDGERRYWMDGWDGYPNARRRLLETIASTKPRNPLVLGGDRHAFFAADLARDPARPEGPVVATEFVGSSITSQGPDPAALQRAVAANPQVRFGRGDRRGYVSVELGVKRAAVGFEAVDDPTQRDSAVRRLATFAVEDGVAGVRRA